MEWFLVFAIVFFAVFTQSVTGFGLALVSMPLLTAVLGIQTAAPLVAFFALVAEAILLLTYRAHLDLHAVWRLAIASVVGVPLGVLALRTVPEEIVLAVLGMVVAGYALYALLKFRLPEIKQPGWAYGAGFLAGVLGGAYNTSGPPVIIYGHCRSWSPAGFKSNLQGFFVLNSIVVLIAHFLAGNYTSQVWQAVLVALPAVVLSIAAGVQLSKRINPATFRRLVLLLLLVLGAWLIVSSLSRATQI
jgi:uncharacterized membrane protein YfcA